MPINNRSLSFRGIFSRTTFFRSLCKDTNVFRRVIKGLAGAEYKSIPVRGRCLLIPIHELCIIYTMFVGSAMHWIFFK